MAATATRSRRSAPAAEPAPIVSLPPIDAIDAELCERSLSYCIQQAWPYMDPAPYVHNWHIDAVCEYCEAVVRGETRKVILNFPPRCMKSLTVGVGLPAWTWLQQKISTTSGPQVKFLYNSYAQDLSTRDSVKTRTLVTSPWYQKMFPGRVALKPDQNQKTRFETTAKGYRLATSVGGTLTGEGGDIIVVDDPHNATEMQSEPAIEAVINWWQQALSTRLNNKEEGAYIVVMQRLRENDLTGHILANEQGWDHLCLPMRYEPKHFAAWPDDPREVEGELLWPARFSERSVQELEQSLGAYGTAGQLQQRPAPEEGGLFHRDWFEFVDGVPAGAVAVRKWDLAATKETMKNDPSYTAGLKLWKDNRGMLYIDDVTRFREDWPEVEKRIKNVASRDGKRCTIGLPQDPGQAGKAQAGYMVRELAGYVVEYFPDTGDKYDRARPVASQAKAGNVKIVRGQWCDMPDHGREGEKGVAMLDAFLTEICTAPNAIHNDMLDALSGAFEMQLSMVPPPAVTADPTPMVSPYRPYESEGSNGYDEYARA